MKKETTNRDRIHESSDRPNSLTTLPVAELIRTPGRSLTPPVLAQLRAAANQLSARYHNQRQLVWFDQFQPVVNHLNTAKALAESGEIFLDGPAGGLVRVRDNALERISKGKDLSAVLSDLVDVQYLTDGKLSTAVPASKLDIALRSSVFREQLAVLDGLTTVPAFAPDWSLLRPGYNGDLGDGYRYFLAGEQPRVDRKLKFLPRFLDALRFESDADRTNAFASGLAPYLRLLYPGRLPVNLYLSKSSFGGKGTLFEATCGLCPRVKINLEAADWANKKNVAIAINADPTTVVVLVDNVDIDLRSAFIESLVTDARQAIHCTGSGDPIGRPYRLVVVVTMNVADVSLDILHRSIPVMLSRPTIVTAWAAQAFRGTGKTVDWRTDDPILDPTVLHRPSSNQRSDNPRTTTYGEQDDPRHPSRQLSGPGQGQDGSAGCRIKTPKQHDSPQLAS
ncbi:MAG TPA: hypothetical protein VFV87_14410 [Pirellulaceae bacterium]|nr:hypothetical protein [Pirellulaceae bacterium]